MSESIDAAFERCFNAAQGYLNLNMAHEAWKELDMIPALYQDNMEVLQLRIWILMRQKKWKEALRAARELCTALPNLPSPWIDVAYCLHEMKKTNEAKKSLLEGPTSLIDYPTFHYNLACYEACLGNEDSARNYLKIAFKMQPSYRKDALHDPDLKSLWDNKNNKI